MRKKLSGLVALCLALLCAVPLGACGKKETDGNTVQKIEPRKVVLADYENYDDIFNTSPNLSVTTFEGHYTLSSLSDREQKATPLSGNDSLELYITGTVGEHYGGYAYDAGTPARFYYDVRNNTKNGGNWGFDWKYLCGASVDVYNDNDFDIRVCMFNVLYDWFPCNYGSVTVSAGEKKTLHVNVNRYFMQKENKRDIVFFSVAVDYDRQVLSDGSLYYPEAYVYFDNLTAEIDENSVYDAYGNPIIDKSFASQSEILNFDEESDLRFMRELGSVYAKESDNEWGTRNWHEGTGSSYYYNKDEKYIHAGNCGSLEWRINPTFQTD